MKVTVNKIGSGTVVGTGEYTEGDTISLSATPVIPSEFKEWIIGNASISDNPYSFTAGDIDLSVIAIFYLPIESWLKNQGYPIDDVTIASILASRNVEWGSDMNSLTQKQKDLILADYLMAVYNTPNTGAEEEQMGNWKSKGKSYTQTGKAGLLSRANSLYLKWGEYYGGNRIIDITNRW